MRIKEITESEYLDNPIPLSPKYNQDNANLDFFVHKIEQLDSVPTFRINVKKLVDSGRLMATQEWLSSYGGGDPVFERLRKAVIAERDGIGYIIDGHHRLAKVYQEGADTFVHWIKL